MTSSANEKLLPIESPASQPVWNRLASLAILIAVDASTIWFVGRLYALGYIPLAAMLLAILLLINVVVLRRESYPIRWMVIGLVFMALFTIYPILFTIWVSFTNYGEGHLVTKEQAMDQILDMKYLPEMGKAYDWTAFRSPEGEYALWLVDADGNGYLTLPGELHSQPQPGELGIVEFDAEGIPKTIEGYEKLNAIIAATDNNLPEILFGEVGTTIQIRSPSEAAELVPAYAYDPDRDAMISEETGIVYENIRGTFSSPDGTQIRPGFVESIKFTNFKEFFISPALRGPLLRIIAWNFGFAFFSLLLNFSLGLAIAIFFNDPNFPFKSSSALS